MPQMRITSNGLRNMLGRKLPAMVIASAFIFCLLMTLVATTVPSIPTVSAHIAYTTHATIFIDGDSDFAAQAASEFWPGDGTSGNPYVIDGLEIDAKLDPGIHINDTTVYFIISNCHIYNGGNKYDGIYLSNCMNGEVTGNLCEDDWSGIDLEDSNNIIVYNNSISNSDKSDQWGIYLYESYDNMIFDNNCSDNEVGIGIETWSEGNIVFNNTCTSNTWDGIELWDNCTSNIVFGNDCTDNLYDGIYVGENSSWNVFYDNNCSDNGDEGVYIDLYSSNNTLTNNICVWNNDCGIYVSYSDNITMTANICNNNSVDGIYAEYANYILMFDNICNDNHGDSGIWTTDADNVTAIGNICNSQPYGLYVDTFENCTLINNTCNDSSNEGLFVGIGDSRNGVIINNVCINNSEGIYLDGFDNGIFANNTCNNNYWGIYLNSYSNNNTIANNNCSNNVYYGIFILLSDNNTVYDNNCSNNDWDGIALDTADHNLVSFNVMFNNSRNGTRIYSGSIGNTLWNNTYIGNNGSGIQAFDAGTNNHWNTSGTTPHGFGNYWDDLTSPDAFAPWGIVDYSYNLTGSSGAKDFYPLTSLPDNDPPVTTATPSGSSGTNGWYVSSVAVSLSAVDDGWGLNATYFRNGTSGAWTKYSSPVMITGVGSHVLQFFSIDNASNAEPVKSVSIKIDTSKPSGSISINGGAAYATNTAAVLTLTASDAGSGVKEVRLSGDNVTWGSWQPFNSSINWTLSSSDGNKTVYCQIMDNASLSTILNDSIMLDTTAPTLTVDQSNGMQVETDYVVISWNGSDATSGIDHFEVSIDGGAFTSIGTAMSYNFTGLVDGPHNITVRAVDAAGNEISQSIQFDVDTSASGGDASGTILLIVVVIIFAAIVGISLVVLSKRGKSKQKQPPMQ